MNRKIKANEGFTLAELLIVVAIIAVLVAVSIPIFTSQLEKARESTDVANFRAAKAAFICAYIDGEFEGNADEERYYDAASGLLVKDFDSVSPYGCGTEAKGYAENFSPYYFVDQEYHDAVIICSYQPPTEGSDGSEALFMWWALNREEAPIGGDKGKFIVNPSER